MSGLGFIAEEPHDDCEMCGKVDELRPYGPNYERICFECGMEDEKMTKNRCFEYILGIKKTVN